MVTAPQKPCRDPRKLLQGHRDDHSRANLTTDLRSGRALRGADLTYARTLGELDRGDSMAEERGAHLVRSAERTLSVLRSFSPNCQDMTLTEVAHAVDWTGRHPPLIDLG